MRRRGWLLVVVLVVAIGSGVAWWWWSQRAGGLPDPATVALPELEASAETRAYLDGEGMNVLALHEAAGHALSDPVRCQDLIDQLAALGSPVELADLALAVPDRTTSDMAVDELDAALVVLASCLRDEEPDDLERLRYAHALLDRRLLALESP